MTNWIKIAVRNIRRNKRRSLVTLMAIALAFASLGLFRGYTDNTYDGLRESAVRGEGIGHLTVFKRGWLSKGKFEPEKYMHSKNEIKRIIELIEEDDHVVLATPQIFISGLVSDGRVSTVFLAKGVIPDHDRTIKGALAALRPIKGRSLDMKKEYGVEIAEDLASQLNLKPGANGVLMTTTLDGQMNAFDMEVSGVYDTGSDATNDKYIRMPLQFAQALYETKKADRIVVLLDDWRKTETFRDKLHKQLSREGLSCEIKTWNELSLFYSKVRGMFDSMFFFIFVIVLIIVVMSTVNTMGMAVMERTREIGTLRALGLKQRGVNVLFAMEGGLLGFFGCLIGIVLYVVAWGAILLVQPTYVPPGVSSAVPLVVNLLPGTMFILTFFLVILSLLAAILPSQRAARLNVVDALRHT